MRDIGHRLSHAIFGGAVASYLLKVNFYLGAGRWGLISVILIDKLTTRREINPDAAIGIITTATLLLALHS